MDISKALSIKQPYANLIAENIKNIENRSFRTHFRGKIYIHASGKWHDRLKSNDLFTKEQWLDLVNKNSKTKFNLYRYLETNVETDRLPVSAIIGEVEIIDCVINHPSIWAEKTEVIGKTVEGDPLYSGKPIWNWVLANAKLYDKPILNVKGKLSFWEPDIEIHQCVMCGDRFNLDDMKEDPAKETFCKPCFKKPY